MGCSPSKGNLFSKPESSGPQTFLLPEQSQERNSAPAEEVKTCLKTNEGDNECPRSNEEHSRSQVASNTAVQNIEGIKETGLNWTTQEIVDKVAQTDKIKMVEKHGKNKKRRSSEKEIKSSLIHKKVDFPPYMVRAHQAAYDFLKPNISKYGTLLGLLDQAAQIQLSLQPTISALVLHFEEINQALEEMAEEGELMLQEHGDYMALPSGMMCQAVMPVKPWPDSAYSPDAPPELLQQLLQHSAEKMKMMAGSVHALSDTTLGDTVEYFSSLSKLLVDKLQAKQKVEQRLSHVLGQVEGATMRKCNPEDSTLHSEDSGIGGESESLTGSERHHCHHVSAGSGSSMPGVSIHSVTDNPPNNLPRLIGQKQVEEEDEEENDDDDDNYEEGGERSGRKRANSSPPDLSKPHFYMHANDIQNQQPKVKRPLTAITVTKSEYSTSARRVNIKMELQKSKEELDQRLKKIGEIRGNKSFVGPPFSLYRAEQRRSSSGSAGTQSGCFLPLLVPHPPKNYSVRSLINTFSQGVDGRPGQSLANIHPHIRRLKKTGISLLSGTINSNERCLVINGNNSNNSGIEDRDDLDVESLPPPPPEVLLDKSFQRSEGILANAEGLQELSGHCHPVLSQKTGPSQRLRACMQNVDLLPNRASLRPNSINILATYPLQQDAVLEAQKTKQQQKLNLDPEKEKDQQAHKIIQLSNAEESPDKLSTAECNGKGTDPLHTRINQRCESKEFFWGDLASCNLPVTAPPVSRVRLPPSCPCPTVRHRFPSPPVCRPQTNFMASCSSSTDKGTEEVVPSVSFNDARSVFCRNESQNSHTGLSLGSSVLPRPWGEASRGRLPTRGTDNFSRRTQSEQRPSLTSHSEFDKDGSSASAQTIGNEPITTICR